MTNFEKYKELIYGVSGEKTFCEFIKETIYPKYGIDPTQCNQLGCVRCGLIVQHFMQEEYQEPETAWSKVPVDTPILVRGNETLAWIKRHFAKYENGIVFAWDLGKTSYTAGKYGCSGWDYAKLYEGKNK